jgi:hypothetical protein
MDQRLIEQWTNVAASDGASLDIADDTMGWVIEALRAEFENRHLVLKQRMQLLEQKVAELTEQLNRT